MNFGELLGETRFRFLIFTLFSLVLYFQCIGYGYVLDDIIVLDQNRFVAKGFSGIWDILSKESFTGYFGEQQNLVAGARYRPLSIVSFALEQGLFGKISWLSHLINLILYGFSAWLVMRFVQRLGIKSEDGGFLSFSMIAALLFLSHPIHSEAVANIKGRDEILCFIFSLLAVIEFLKFHDHGQNKHRYRSGLYLFLGLMSKENAVTFLAVAPLILVLFRKQSWKQALNKSLFLIIPIVLFLVIRTAVIGYFFDSGQKITDLMNNPFVGMKGTQQFASILVCLAWYIKLLFVPYPLTHDYYPYHVPKMDLFDPLALIALLFLIALMWLCFRFRKTNQTLWFGFLYFWITISIVSNIVFPVGTFMNERFLFMPSLGFIMILAYFFSSAAQYVSPLKRKLIVSLYFLILIAYSGITMSRVPDWKDSMSLNLSGVKVSKNSARVNMFTGVSYFQEYQKESNPELKRKHLDKALHYINRSLIIFPNYGQGLNMKAGILAEYHKMDKNLKGFLEELREVIIRKPDLAFVHEYIQYLSKDELNRVELSEFLRNLAYDHFYLKQLKYDIAVQYMTMARDMRPFNQKYAEELADIYTAWSRKPGLSNQQKEEFLKKADQIRNPLLQ